MSETAAETRGGEPKASSCRRAPSAACRSSSVSRSRRWGACNELAAIEVECEAAAAPIALEIERLESEEAEIAASARISDDRRAEIERLQREHVELTARIAAERAAQDARLRSEFDRLTAEATELDMAFAQRTFGRQALDASLADARERFNAARTTSRGRHLERSVKKIEKQQETIVARNPGAKFFRVEMAINAEAGRLGYLEKARAVSAAMRDAKFGEQLAEGILAFRAGKRAEPSEFEVKTIAVDVIRGMDVSVEDIELRVVYRHGNVHIEAHVSDEARSNCLASLMAAQSKPVAAKTEGAAEATAA